MAPPNDSPRRAGLPAAESVLFERTLTPRRPGLAAAEGARTYRIIRTAELDPYEKPISREELAALTFESIEAAGDDFRGTSRRAAKISIADADIEVFDDLSDLLDSLVAEEDMVDHDPRITTDRDSDRVEEEIRNVQVRAFLYAASREKDNDYHLILGRDPELSPPLYMTMELSGLPPAGDDSFDTLKAARDAYKDFFGSDLPGTSYDFYDPPIPVEIGGSLFFDMSHASGSRPGPQSLRDDMPTIWEVHPVTEIVFEP